jgi:hypothetical protein
VSDKRKLVAITIEQKLEAVRRIKNGEILRNVAEDFGVGISDFFSYKFVVLYCICKYHTHCCAIHFINIRRVSE